MAKWFLELSNDISFKDCILLTFDNSPLPFLYPKNLANLFESMTFFWNHWSNNSYRTYNKIHPTMNIYGMIPSNPVNELVTSDNKILLASLIAVGFMT